MEQRWSGVDQNTEQWDQSAERSDQNAEQRGSKCGAKVEQNAEQGGAKRGARWSKTRSKVEQGILFLFDSKLESCLEASSFKYRITEISEKGLY